MEGKLGMWVEEDMLAVVLVGSMFVENKVAENMFAPDRDWELVVGTGLGTAHFQEDEGTSTSPAPQPRLLRRFSFSTHISMRRFDSENFTSNSHMMIQ